MADQLSAYILLTPGDDGQVDPKSIQSIQSMKDLARTLGATGTQPEQLGGADSPDVHSLDQVRMTTSSAGSTDRIQRRMPTL